VLACLRLHRFISRNDEQHRIHTARAGEHRPHESLVAGHVDDRHVEVADRRVRESEIDRDPAFLLFFEAIGIGAGQGFDERAFAVIDVPGGADYKGMGQWVSGSVGQWVSGSVGQ
jgi:hypothetical protein